MVRDLPAGPLGLLGVGPQPGSTRSRPAPNADAAITPRNVRIFTGGLLCCHSGWMSTDCLNLSDPFRRGSRNRAVPRTAAKRDTHHAKRVSEVEILLLDQLRRHLEDAELDAAVQGR